MSFAYTSGSISPQTYTVRHPLTGKYYNFAYYQEAKYYEDVFRNEEYMYRARGQDPRYFSGVGYASPDYSTYIGVDMAYDNKEETERIKKKKEKDSKLKSLIAYYYKR